MNANEAKLQPILEGTKQYVVPLFQRPYSWDKDQWGRLWDDLKELCEESNPRNHFMGSIVTMPTTSVPEGVTKYLLIDGQQRLTTIFIILALLRDRATQNANKELAEEIHNTLLVNTYKKEGDYFKLLPTQNDRSHFQNLIESTMFDESNSITNAYKFFDRKIKQNNINEELLKKIITNHLSVISILLDINDNPYLVFEGLNAKGKPLSQADLIRNYFFMRIHVNDQERIYHLYWKPMQDALGEDLTEFIRHYLMKDGTFVRQNDVYFMLKDLTSKEDVIQWLEDLKRFADYYQKITDPLKEDNANIRLAMSRINRLQVTTIFPFLLNCYHNYHIGMINAGEFIDILRIIENFIIRRYICNVPTNQLNKIFPPLNLQIQNASHSSFVDGARIILQNKGYPKDIEFKERLKDAKLYGQGDRAIKTKLILETIEESFGHKERIDFEGVQLEHIMPQTLDPNWKDYLGDDWEKTHDLLLHSLGNLTLTAYNPEISNAKFDQKKKYYSESHIEMNKYFSDISEWKKEDIERRSEFLSDKALEIWPYFGNEGTESNEKGILTGKSPRELVFLGERIKTSTWRDVLEATMNTILDFESEKFDEIMKQFPHFIGWDGKNFKTPRKLKNGAFIEVDHLSAKTTQRLCFQILEIIGLTSEDWHVETKND
jgi:uncharacterized protein with ParB-like and HNH nuclease domain